MLPRTMAEMTEDEVDALSKATAEALGAVDHDVSRWKEAGAVAPGVVALLYTGFCNRVYNSGLAGWVGEYTQRGEHRVLATLTRMNAARDPDMADVLLEAFTRVERLRAEGAEASSLPHFLDLLLWERPQRRVRFGLAAAAQWDAGVDPFALPPPEWAPARAPLAPREGSPRYPGVAVGLSPRGAHLAVRMEDFQAFDFLSVVGAVVRGLWRAGVTDEELDRFAREAGADRAHLGEVCARWIHFDGDGGDAARFQHLRDVLQPPDPLLPFFPGLNEWSGVFLVPGALSERVQDALPTSQCAWLSQTAAGLQDVLVPLVRANPPAIGVLRGDTLEAKDLDLLLLLLRASYNGLRIVVVGMRDEAKQALQREAERFHCSVRESSLS